MSVNFFFQNFKANFFEYTNEKCTGQTEERIERQTEGQRVFLYTQLSYWDNIIIIDKKIQFWFQDKPSITIISTKTEVLKKGILYFIQIHVYKFYLIKKNFLKLNLI